MNAQHCTHHRPLLILVLAVTALVLFLGAPAHAAPPDNDERDSATLIEKLPATFTQDTSGTTFAASDPPSSPFCEYGGPTVWFRYNAADPRVTQLSIDTFGSDYDTVQIIMVDYGGGSLGIITCNDNLRGIKQSHTILDITPGATYYIMVAGYGPGEAGNLTLNVKPLAPPSNDDFDDATVIGSLPVVDWFDSNLIGRAADDPYCGFPGRTAWYAYTPAEDVTLWAHTLDSLPDTVVGVYTGSRGSLNQIDCSSGDYPLDDGAVLFEAEAGTTYYIMVGTESEFGWGYIRFTLMEAPIPPNDNVDNATPVTALPAVFTQDLDLATSAGDEPDCLGAYGLVWYVITPAEDLHLSAWTEGSNFDTVLCAYKGEPGNLTQIAANDDAFRLTSSYLLFPAPAGKTTYLAVGAYGGGLRSLKLRLQETAAPPPWDDFDHAAVPDELPFSVTVSSGELTRAGDDPIGCPSLAYGYPTAWFAYTPDRDISLVAEALASNPPILIKASPDGVQAPAGYPGLVSVFTGERGNLREIGCGSSEVRLDAEAGVTYYFMVRSYNDGPLAKVLFHLREAAPPATNDDFDDALPITALPFHSALYIGYTTHSPDDPPYPGCDETVWYRYTPQRRVELDVDTAGSDHDTVLAVYTGARGALTRIAANDDSDASFQSRLRLTLHGGETYHFMVCAHATDVPRYLAFNVRQISYSSFLPLLDPRSNCPN